MTLISYPTFCTRVSIQVKSLTRKKTGQTVLFVSVDAPPLCASASGDVTYSTPVQLNVAASSPKERVVHDSTAAVDDDFQTAKCKKK